MSNLSTKERNQLPDSAFCYVKGSGDKKVRLFPILDQDDVNSAAHLIGKSPDPEGTKACIIGKAKAKGWTVPDAWKGSAKHSLLAQDDEARALFAGEEMVVRRGKVWEAGEYPDKQFGMTPEEVLAASLDFQPVPVNSGHPAVPSPLDGLLGELRGIELSPDDGVSVIGEVAIPKWLHEVLPPGDIPVSMEWDRETKRPAAISIVSDPRVSDAALVAAFAKRHDTPAGQRVMQRIHDVAAEGGAVCKKANVASYASSHEASAMQQVHDVAAEHGAKCQDMSQPGMPVFYGRLDEGAPAKPAKARFSMSWFSDFFRLAKAAPEGFDPDEFFQATGQGAPSQQPAAPAQTNPATFSAATEREKALEAELQRERAKGILRDAEAFATKIINEERAFPMEKDAIIAAYSQAAVDDNRFGTVTFASGQQGNRVGVLTAAYEARPAHQLTQEQIKPELQKILFNQTQTPDPNAPQDVTPEAIADYLRQTPLGQQALAARNGK